MTLAVRGEIQAGRSKIQAAQGSRRVTIVEGLHITVARMSIIAL